MYLYINNYYLLQQTAEGKKKHVASIISERPTKKCDRVAVVYYMKDDKRGVT